MSTKRSPLAIAAEREVPAGDLDKMIDLLGRVYGHYNKLTREISEATGVDQGHALTNPIYMRMSEAGLGALLARNLVGKVPSLRDLVASHHGKLLNAEGT